MPRHLRSWSEKRLLSPLRAPTNGPIGKPIGSLLPAGAVKLQHLEQRASAFDPFTRATDTFDFNGDGRADAILETSTTGGVVDQSRLRVLRPGAERQQLYLASSTGRVDGFFDGNGKDSTWFNDNDRDGRIDEVRMSGADRGTFTLEGHRGTPLDWDFKPVPLEPGKLPSQVTVRGFKDTDGDGTFDQEFVAGLWWRTDD